MRNNSLLIALLLMGIMLFAACGGGGSTTVAGDPADTTGDLTANEEPAAQTYDEWAAGTELTGTETEVPTTVSYRALPALPVDSGHDTSAADYTQTVLGREAIDYSQCAVNGDAMIINDGGAADTNPEGIPAWALYRISGLTDLDPVSLNTECLVGASGMEYSVAVADYTAMEWKWYGPTTLPEYQADLAGDHSYITNIGNLYFLVVCYGANTATHAQSTIVCDDPVTTTLPGAPGELVASKGEIEGGVGLEWLAGSGAEYYEIFRQDELWFYEGDPVPGFDPEGEWFLLDSTEDTNYFDQSVEPGIVYMYKVRSVNSAGYSNFSNIDEGWAWDEIEPPYDGIYGWVWGEDWTRWEDDDPPGDNYDPTCGCFPEMIPLAGATLTLFIATDSGAYYEYTATSGEDGFYAFDEDMAPGEYLLVCELDGWVFYDEYSVPVGADLEPRQYDFIGFPEGTDPPYIPEDGIHGWVWGEYWPEGDPHGLLPPIMPLENAHIQVFAADSASAYAECNSNADGFFQFPELPAGTYLMTCELENWEFEPPEYLFEFEGETPSMGFDFFGYHEGDDPSDEEGVCGWVWGEYWEEGDPHGLLPPILGLEDATLTVFDAAGVVVAETQTDERGFYQILELPGGDFLLTCELDGWVFDPPEYTFSVGSDGLEPQWYDFLGHPEGWVPPDPEPLPAGLSGWVWEMANEAGEIAPMAGVDISVLGDDGDLAYTLSSDADGFFHLPEIAAGHYIVSASCEGFEFEPPEHPVVFIAEEMAPVQVDFWGYPAGVEPRPGPWPPVTAEGLVGWVYCLTDPAGNGFYPLADALVTVTSLDDTGYMYTANTDEEGNFYVPITDFGGYTVSVTREGYTIDPASLEFELNEAEPLVHAEFVAFEND